MEKLMQLYCSSVQEAHLGSVLGREEMVPLMNVIDFELACPRAVVHLAWIRQTSFYIIR